MAINYKFRTQLLFQYLKNVQTRYDIHSPFTYQFILSVWDDHNDHISFRIIENYRKQLKKSSTVLNIEDFGAGYDDQHKPTVRKALRDVVRSSARAPKGGRLLHKLVKFQQPKVALELGANLGFSTAYQASAMPPDARFMAVEGSHAIIQQAAATLQHTGTTAEMHHERFDRFLQHLIEQDVQLDYVLLDGHHCYTPTLQYYNAVSQQAAPGALVIIDDIHWSPGMQQAWQEIKVKPEVSISIDLFTMGLLFLKRNQVQEHFTLFSPL